MSNNQNQSTSTSQPDEITLEDLRTTLPLLMDRFHPLADEWDFLPEGRRSPRKAFVVYSKMQDEIYRYIDKARKDKIYILLSSNEHDLIDPLRLIIGEFRDSLLVYMFEATGLVLSSLQPPPMVSDHEDSESDEDILQ
ncbi:hypothetical protein DSL72_006830 [Monilinia vaccinii-corymbosi]|uniref:Uncharacterized protein n=1 Tax=Monilinia vaccinii-corymbosi TaxID=61207 RepID=A0A8A3PK58_9HELO|nr:hypothetical protein DSL72_006830 [Monilinia vaccinii-corymbosi]